MLSLAIALIAGAPAPQAAPILELRWTPDRAPAGERAPRVVPFLDGHGLAFERARGTFLDLGQGDGENLRVKGALTIAVLLRMEREPPGKVSLVSKWRLVRGGRSYELGVTASRRLFFTISASGSWPEQARELLSTRPLAVGVPYAVAAAFEPGARMGLFINGVPSGETTVDVPRGIYDSATSIYLGSRCGDEAACAFDGHIGAVSIYSAAADQRRAAAWAQRAGLTAPPEPEIPTLKPPYDLDAVRERTRAWYRALQAPDRPYGAYRLTVRSEPDLYASADIAWIRWMMDDLDLAPEQRRQWIAFIQDQQDAADGSYRHITGHCTTHAFCHATGALNMLGGKGRYAPKLLAPYRDVAGVPAWLDGINWVNQWGASHDIWGAGVPLVCTPDTPAAWKDAVFAWLDAEADPQTGFWRKGVEARRPMEYLGGAFHIWPLYAAMGRQIPYPERVIDSVLALQSADGSFGGGFDYGAMDGIWVLAYLTERIPYRRDEVRHALERSLHGLMRLYHEAPDQFFSSAHSTESRIAIAAILQGALPQLAVSTKPWRNPWHRPELFVIRVE